MTETVLDTDRVNEALANLGFAINEVDQLLAKDATLEERAHWLRALDTPIDGLYQQLAQVRDNLKTNMAKQMPRGEDVETSAGTLTWTKVGKKESWDWPLLLPRIASRISDDIFHETAEGGGEVPPLAVIAERACRALGNVIGLTPSKAGRKGEIEKLGLDANHYITSEGGTPSVRFKA